MQSPLKQLRLGFLVTVVLAFICSGALGQNGTEPVAAPTQEVAVDGNTTGDGGNTSGIEGGSNNTLPTNSSNSTGGDNSLPSNSTGGDNSTNSTGSNSTGSTGSNSTSSNSTGSNSTGGAMTPTMAPTETKFECYNNLTILAAHIRDKTQFETKTYIICPDTVYDIGQTVYDLQGMYCCSDGHSQLTPRTNTRIMCGEDGRSENNCTLRYGPFQVVYVYSNFWEQTTGSEIWGMTFESSQIGAVLLGNGGDITFHDCIFRNHTGQGAIISNFNYAGKHERTVAMDELSKTNAYWQIRLDPQQYVNGGRGNERRLAYANIGNTDQLGAQRELQHEDVVWMRQESTFRNCLFEKNAQDNGGDATIFGTITIQQMYDDMQIINTTFFNNNFGESGNALGYAVSVAAGSTLTLKDNCFIGNNFVGDGVVIMQNANDLRNISNNYVTQDDGITCQFIAIKSTDATDACLNADAAVCTLAGAPPSAPVALSPPTAGVAVTSPSAPATSPTPPTSSGNTWRATSILAVTLVAMGLPLGLCSFMGI